MRLNWSFDIAMVYWEGVIAGGDPPRVFDLSLKGTDNDVLLPLTDEILAELGSIPVGGRIVR